MTTKSLTLIATLIVGICISNQPAVKAGAPPTSVNKATGTAILKGAVKFEGRTPKPAPINMATDPGCAKQHLTPVLSQDVVTDAKGGLQNVVVFIADGLSEQPFETPSQPVVLDQKGCLYQPHVLAMQANQRMEVVNDDPTSHNIHPIPANNREWNKSEPPDPERKKLFRENRLRFP